MQDKGTIYRQFIQSSETHTDTEAAAVFNNGRYVPITFGELRAQVDIVAQNLMKNGCKKGDRIGLMMHNGPEWMTVDLACARSGFICVPIHTTYNSHYVDMLIDHAEIECLFISSDVLPKIEHSEKVRRLKMIYVLSDSEKSAHQGRNIKSFGSLLEKRAGLISDNRDTAVKPDDVHTIVYTSGTTGHPKGVMLSHRNIISNVRAVTEKIPVYATDRFLSFLPASHILERTAGYYAPLFSGAAIYYCRNTQTLADDMRIAQPTIIVCVPRIFEKVHEKILAKFSKSKLLQSLFNQALAVSRMKRQGKGTAFDSLKVNFFDIVFFSKIRSAFGGRLRFAVSGGASLAKHIAEFFELIGILVIEGYGLSETSPILTVNTIKKHKFGAVGKPLQSTEISIGPEGEILARGLGLMKGYYKAPDLTEQVIDSEGWFHTGDMGYFDSEGYLTINGRLKEMIVLSTGRNVFPVPIEQELEESRYIAQAMVYGDNQRSIAGLIVPEFDQLKKWCEEHGVTYTLPDILNNRLVLDFYRKEISQSLSRMQSFEQVKNFILLPTEFTQENDMLTPSLKLKRTLIIEKCKVYDR